jgi:hypothetical protein
MLSVVSTETSSTSLVTMEAAPEEKGPKMDCANCANSHWMPRAGDQSFGHQGFSSRLLRNLQNLQNPGSRPNLATGRSRKPESRNLRNLQNP